MKKHNNQTIQDSHFGELIVTFDELDPCYYLHQSITLEGLTDSIELYLQCSRPYPNSFHQLTHELIVNHFPTLWEKALYYLIEKGMAENKEEIQKICYPESITIKETINSIQLPWELELLSLEDLISSFNVEFINNTPIHYYIHA